MNRTIRLLGVSATAGILSFGISAPSAMAMTSANAAAPTAARHTESFDYTRVIQSRSSGRCLDDSFQYGLRFFPCNNLGYQKFTVHNLNGPVTLVNQATGRCVWDSPNGIRATNCDRVSNNQAWYINNWGTGGVGISNRSTGRCIYHYVVQKNVSVIGTTQCNWNAREQSFLLR